MPSLANSNAGPMSNTTWLQAKKQVAEVVGGHNDPEALNTAAEQIVAVLQDWNTRRNWQFLQVKAEDITVTAGTAEYTLPTTFKRPYGALFNTDTLQYITRREYNRIDALQGPSHPTHYTLFNHASTGKIELIPNPAESGVLKVWYYRLMSDAVTEDGTLDVLGRYTNYLLDAAKARLLAIKGPVEKLSFWLQAAEQGYAKAVADDMDIPDEDLGFSPRLALYGVPSPNSFAWVDWGW